MRYISLYVYYFIYYIAMGMSTFIPKYYGEIGMSNAQIGLLSSVPTMIALIATPFFGTLTDRMPKKRYLLTVMLLLYATVCLLVPYSTGFAMLLAIVSVITVMSNNVLPIMNTIAIEYTGQIGKSFGPIRLMGTMGYQLGAVLIGFILTTSLGSLYPMMGATFLVTCGITFLLPDVKGHQHKREKVPITKLFADKHLLLMYGMLFFSAIATQFYQAFYTKHLGDIGMNNQATSIITLLAVILEIPFLLCGDKLYKKTSIWNWILIGMICNGVRWLGLAYSTTPLMNILFQLPSVTVLACFDFFPALYLSKRVSPKLYGGAQSMLALVNFSISKVVGSLVGGQICQYTGIPVLFEFFGFWMLLGAVVFWFITRKLSQDSE